MGDFERIKDSVSLHDFAAQFLTKSRGGMWCCPACGSGTRGTANSDGALSITSDGKHWECFSCHARGDVFDLAGIVWNIAEDDRRARLQAVAGWAGIELEQPAPSGFQAKWTQYQTSESTRQEKESEQPAPDYAEGRKKEAEYIRRAQDAIENPEAVSYLSERGFTIEEAKAAGIGYDPAKKRLVIPWSGVDWYHIDRAISDSIKPKYLKPARDKVGSQPLYNQSAAEQPAYFIVEGVIDAIAVHLCGFEAIAIASNDISAENTAELTAGITAHSGGIAVVMLDNDEKGREGSEKVCSALEGASIPHILAGAKEGAPKDAGDWFKEDKGGLRAFLEGEYSRAVESAEALKERDFREAMKSFHLLDPLEVATKILNLEDCETPTPTGIGGLDEVLGGGLKSGLYALGAVSSIGKTTLAIQIADYIAEHGAPVLFVTIEQSAREIVAKSLSRYTYLLNKGGWDVISATEAVSAERREYWSGATNAAFLIACEHYKSKVGARLRIQEGAKQPSVNDIKAAAEFMQGYYGKQPVIFIDYLQLMSAGARRSLDRRTEIDGIVTGLRQLARDMKTSVFVISSVKREAYTEGVTMEAFKESGGIEYSCDVLLGLQAYGLRKTIDEARASRLKRDTEKAIRKHKAGKERACEIVVLKNRNGATPEEGIPITFKPLSSVFTEGVEDIVGEAPTTILM